MGKEAIDIKGFVETSFSDWTGKMAAVLFLPGCNYRCPYCHNHALVTAHRQMPSWPLEEVLHRLDNLRGWLDGVCVTGGEPCISPWLGDLIGILGERGWAVKLDTNGSKPSVVEELISAGLVSAWSVDLKAPLTPFAYSRAAGVGASPENVRRSLELLAGAGAEVELRTTFHPSLLSEDDLWELINSVKDIFGPEKSLKLQLCSPKSMLDPSLGGLGGFEKAELTALAEKLGAAT